MFSKERKADLKCLVLSVDCEGASDDDDRAMNEVCTAFEFQVLERWWR